ncbi:hypothetical protein IWQ56_001885 [Coemansia nantahalensis]|nr:hypothetical protein IWQ56_001885 [Coemansia nantahalensis]
MTALVWALDLTHVATEAQQLPPAAAADVVISTSDGGTKPVLAASCREKFWGVADFNIAHDGCWVLAGVTGRGVIGVDVARIHCPDGMSDHEYIAGFAQQLSDGERAYLARHSTDMLRDFYRVWTAKEAYVKATGTGIVDVDLATIDVSLAPDGQAGVRANGQPVPLELRAGSLDSSHVFCVAAARGVAWALRTIGPSDL